MFNGKIHYKWPFSIAMLQGISKRAHDCHGTEGSTELGALSILTENLRFCKNVANHDGLYSTQAANIPPT